MSIEYVRRRRKYPCRNLRIRLTQSGKNKGLTSVCFASEEYGQAVLDSCKTDEALEETQASLDQKYFGYLPEKLILLPLTNKRLLNYLRSQYEIEAVEED